MHISIYKDHASLITNLDRMTKHYACAECQARFTIACRLWWHAEVCTRGATKVVCRGEQIHIPETAYENRFTERGPMLERR